MTRPISTCGGHGLVGIGPGVRGMKPCPGCADCRPLQGPETPKPSVAVPYSRCEAHGHYLMEGQACPDCGKQQLLD